MQKKKFKYFFKLAAIVAILDFGPSPKFNGMILGPYLTPPTKFHRNPSRSFSGILFTNKQTNKRRNLSVATAVSIVASIVASIAGGGGGPVTKP